MLRLILRRTWFEGRPHASRRRLRRLLSMRTTASTPDDSPQQIARRIERNERDAFLREILLGPLQPIDEGDDLAHPHAAIAHRAHRVHHRVAFGGDVVEQNDRPVGFEIAVDLSLVPWSFIRLRTTKPATEQWPRFADVVRANKRGDL